jgi:YHS domain-containing protein
VTRALLLLILLIIVARMFWRVVDGVIEGVRGQPPATRKQSPSVPMVRDPVCGTFVLPERAVVLVEGRRQVYFCSDACRDKYRARTA